MILLFHALLAKTHPFFNILLVFWRNYVRQHRLQVRVELNRVVLDFLWNENNGLFTRDRRVY